MSPGAASYSSHLIVIYRDSKIRLAEQVQKLHSIQSSSPIFRFCFSKILCKISKLIHILSSMNASSLLSTQSYLNAYSHIPSIIGDNLVNLESEDVPYRHKKDLQSLKRKHSGQ